MLIFIPSWAWPTAATLVIALAFIIWPVPGPRGDYDFGGQIMALFLAVFAVIATLVVWLVYFIIV